MLLSLSSPPENLIGQAQSGSGKTATFALGMLYRVDVNLKAPQAVCVWVPPVSWCARLWLW